MAYKTVLEHWTHTPVDRRLLQREDEQIVFAQRRKQHCRYSYELSPLAGVLNSVAPVIPLLAGILLFAIGGCMLNASAGQGPGAGVLLTGMGLIGLCFLMIWIDHRLSPKLPEDSEHTDLQQQYLVRFDKRRGLCELIGPIHGQRADAELAPLREPVIASQPWSRLRLALSEIRTTPWSDLYDQPPWEDESTDDGSIDALGLKLIGQPPQHENEVADFGGRFWLWDDSGIEAPDYDTRAAEVVVQRQAIKDFIYG